MNMLTDARWPANVGSKNESETAQLITAKTINQITGILSIDNIPMASSEESS